MADDQTPATPPPDSPAPTGADPMELPTTEDPGLINVKEFSQDERVWHVEQESDA